MINLATLETATEQEVFDQVVTHLLTQGRKSEVPGGSCMYRHKDLKCAAGCLISDEEYNPEWETKIWDKLVSDYGVSGAHQQLIEDLQDIHDNHWEAHWIRELIQLAEDYKLNTNALSTELIDRFNNVRGVIKNEDSSTDS